MGTARSTYRLEEPEMAPIIEIKEENTPYRASKQKKINTRNCIWALLSTVLCMAAFMGLFQTFKKRAVSRATVRHSQVTAVFRCFGELQNLQTSFSSFLKTNSYQLQKIIVIIDVSDINLGANQFLEKYRMNSKVQTIITGQQLGELAVLDMAYANIKTPYVFSAGPGWLYNRGGFIQEALVRLKADRRLNQVVVTKIPGVIETRIGLSTSVESGFSLMPSLVRLSTYRLLQMGYSGLTFKLSDGKMAGNLEERISYFYRELGFHIDTVDAHYAHEIKSRQVQIKLAAYAFPPTMYAYKQPWKLDERSAKVCRLMLLREKEQYKFLANKLIHKKHHQVQLSLDNTESPAQLVNSGLADTIIPVARFDPRTKQIADYDAFRPNLDDLAYKLLPGFEKFNEQEERQIYQTKDLNFSRYEEWKQSFGQADHEQLLTRIGAQIIRNYTSDLQINEYIMYAKDQNLDLIGEESSICIVWEHFNIQTRGNFLRLVESINSQNYSNYKIVVLDDSSTGGNYLFLEEKQELRRFRNFTNRVAFNVLNYEPLGTPGNHYLRVSRFCSQGDIVVAVRGNDYFISNQAFNLINAAYQNSLAWMVLFRAMVNKQGGFFFQEPVGLSSDSLRVRGVDTDTYLVTYRYEAIQKLPFRYVSELVINLETKNATPKFYETESNIFHVYSLIESLGNENVLVKTYPIYVYERLQQRGLCWAQKEEWTKFKARIMIPINFETNLSKQENQHDQTYELMGIDMKINYKNYQLCNERNSIYWQQKEVNRRKAPFFNMLADAVHKLRVPEYYLTFETAYDVQELPFCIVVSQMLSGHKDRTAELVASVDKQDYKNWRLLVLHNNNVSLSDDIIAKARTRGHQLRILVAKGHSYLHYRDLLKIQCVPNSLVMFLTNRLLPGALKSLNKIHQRQSAWITYSQDEHHVQINTFYTRIYELLNHNDFYETNRIYLEKGDQQIQALGMLEMCANSSYAVQFVDIYSMSTTADPENQIAYLKALKNSDKVYERHIYNILIKLSDETQIDNEQYLRYYHQFSKGKDFIHRPTRNSNVSKFDILHGHYFEQIMYLPSEHLLNKMELLELDRKYQIVKYNSGQYAASSKRFCVTVFGRNNTPFGRVQKNLQSILMQNYSNYHIVFMDDASDDHTYEAGKQFLRKSNFPRERVKLVRNFRRMFATYNIINAGYNFCKEDEVQIRLDGDDEIIGKYAFSTLNALYQQEPDKWVIYTNFKSNKFWFGVGFQASHEKLHYSCDGSMKREHFISPLTSWQVKLLRKIPLQKHLSFKGGWLQFMSDESLQINFFDLAGLDRIKYISQIMYEYNTGYGYNGNSNSEKALIRETENQVALTNPRAKRLANLEEIRDNSRLVQILKADIDKQFKMEQLTEYL